jgi:hypothetical protein
MRGRKYEEEPSGDAAIFEYAMVNFADSAATTRSPGKGEAHSPARGHPIDGHDHRLGRTRQTRDRAMEIRGQLLDHHPDAVGVVVEVLDVAPAQKALPAPVTTMQRTARSSSASRVAWKRSPPRARFKGVVGFGTVEREGGHAVFDLIADRLVAHTGLL